jgi:hypothetical protein
MTEKPGMKGSLYVQVHAINTMLNLYFNSGTKKKKTEKGSGFF